MTNHMTTAENANTALHLVQINAIYIFFVRHEWNLDELMESIWDYTQMIRIYTKVNHFFLIDETYGIVRWLRCTAQRPDTWLWCSCGSTCPYAHRRGLMQPLAQAAHDAVPLCVGMGVKCQTSAPEGKSIALSVQFMTTIQYYSHITVSRWGGSTSSWTKMSYRSSRKSKLIDHYYDLKFNCWQNLDFWYLVHVSRLTVDQLAYRPYFHSDTASNTIAQ